MGARGWEIEELPNGTYDIRHDGKAVEYDRDYQECIEIIRRAEGRGAEFVQIEVDGYRQTRRA